MYSNGIRFPINMSINKAEFDALEAARHERGRSMTSMITAIVRNATSDFTDFSILDQSPVYQLRSIPPNGSQSYRKVNIQCSYEQHEVVKMAASYRTRPMTSMLRAIIYQATRGLVDFSIVDQVVTTQGGHNASDDS